MQTRQLPPRLRLETCDACQRTGSKPESSILYQWWHLGTNWALPFIGPLPATTLQFVHAYAMDSKHASVHFSKYKHVYYTTVQICACPYCMLYKLLLYNCLHSFWIAQSDYLRSGSRVQCIANGWSCWVLSTALLRPIIQFVILNCSIAKACCCAVNNS